MSVMGLWTVATVSSTVMEALRANAHASEQPTAPDDLSWWRIMDDAALVEPARRGFGRAPTDEALRFIDMIDTGQPEWDADAWMDSLNDLDESDVFVATLRKGNPVAALYYGLGYEASHALPGRFGCFLLTAADVAAVTPIVETTLTMDAHRRAGVLDRMRAWLDVTADDGGDSEIDNWIDGPLRVLRRAREVDQGAFATVGWF